MDNSKGRKLQNGDSDWKAEVIPRGFGASADLSISKQVSESPMFGSNLMEEVCERYNLLQALERVRRNKGGAGVDGMQVEELSGYLKHNWFWIREKLFDGSYLPKPVKRVEIPKPGNKGKRLLGIPCVLDRFIQQAILQVLQRKWDRRFSDNSYGFRPGRSAHQAIAQAQHFVREGYSTLVDIDLEKFFDTVCHDRLMNRLAEQVEDKRVLKLVRSYLSAGIMEAGLVSFPEKGTPQGGPLSPFLSNIVLHELDLELEKRGHKFVRYCDDCNIFVKSQRAGERVMEGVTQFLENRLKLKVNATKSAVDRPQNRKFLGFTLTDGRRPNRRKIALESIKRFRAKVRMLTRRNQGKSLKSIIDKLAIYLRGWKGYFGFCETPYVLRDLDSWIRRRLRSIQWKQWKVYKRRRTELIRLGLNEENAHLTAWSSKGPWRNSHMPGIRMALNNNFFDGLGLPRLLDI